MAKFASYCMESNFCTFNPGRDYKPSAFRKDIKDFIIQSGSLRKRISFLITDNNVVANFILEDINNLLNNGEIPNLLDSGETNKVEDNLREYVKSIGLLEVRENFLKTFVDQTRENLHIMFCTSPVGETLKTRFKKFPSLINCCTLNWLVSWPTEALKSCSENIYSNLE